MSTCPACDSTAHGPSYLGEGRWRTLRFSYRACHACGTLFVDPMPDAQALDELYAPAYLEEHYAPELAGEATSAELGRELEETAAHAAAMRPGGRLLDVGCGAGRFLIAARRAGLGGEGFERVQATAEKAAAATGATVHAGSLESLVARGLRYDLIHFADVLEHCPRPIGLLAPARALLASEGLVIARGPLQNQPTLFQQTLRLQRLMRARLGRLAPLEAPPMHVVLFTRAGWHSLIRRAGFALQEEQFYEVHWPAPERFTPRPVWLIKALSLALSRSPVGRYWELGDRVVSTLSLL
ncbi:MAG TPA: methyltransferase domain-containing protein [Polyangia bacterium]|jgi:SAM-dependent methyltransferase|nr:methyltransferase domain-containing protein [Polyangia bacterium]